MKHIISIRKDTHNSDPVDTLHVQCIGGDVHLRISNEEREVTIDKKDFTTLADIFKMEN